MNKNWVVTLVAGQSDLGQGREGAVQMILDEHGCKSFEALDVLSKNHAVDIFCEFQPSRDCITEIRRFLSTSKIDVFVNAVEGRRKKLLVADMDSTIVAGETLDDVARKAGLGLQVSAITQRAMKGELDFRASLTERIALLSGKPWSLCEAVRAELKLNKGALNLVKTMRYNNAACVLISGGFTYFTSYIAEQCGFTHHHGNMLEKKEGKISGFLSDPILDERAKLTYMTEYMSRYHVKAHDVLAIGDGANDKAIVQAAGLGIGYYAKPALATITPNLIRFGDLTSALYAQGYKQEEIL